METTIVIENSNWGATSDINGEYFIINIPPGSYTLKVSMIGYETVILSEVIVSVNRTTAANFKMNETVIQGKRC